LPRLRRAGGSQGRGFAAWTSRGKPRALARKAGSRLPQHTDACTYVPQLIYSYYGTHHYQLCCLHTFFDLSSNFLRELSLYFTCGKPYCYSSSLCGHWTLMLHSTGLITWHLQNVITRYHSVLISYNFQIFWSVNTLCISSRVVWIFAIKAKCTSVKIQYHCRLHIITRVYFSTSSMRTK